MKDRSILGGPGGLRGRKDGERDLPARPQYLEAPSGMVIEEPGPGLLLEYIQIIRRNKGTLAFITSLGLLTSLLLTLAQKPIYQARASMEIQNLNENFLNMRDISPTRLAADGGDSSALQPDLQTQVKILQSESVLYRVITELNLDEKLSRAKDRGRLSAGRDALGLPHSRRDLSREEVLGLVTKNLTIKTEPNTRLVEIFYDSPDPRLAAEFVNTLIAEFMWLNIEDRLKTTRQTGEWLTQQMGDIRIKLEKSEDDLQSYAYSSGLLFTSEKVGSQLLEDNVAEEKLRQLQEQLSAAHADRVAKQSTYELVSSAPPESLPKVLDDKTLGEYHVRLTDLRRQLAELSSTLAPANPAVRKVQAQVNTLDSALQQERANVIQRIRNEYQSAYRNENMLAANYATQAGLVSEQAAKVAHYNILKSDVDSNRQLYDSMLRDVHESGMTSGLRASNIRVVDSGVPPTRPYKPSLILNSSLGLLAGAFFGLVFVVMRERADRSIQAPGEAELSLGIPELGVIPSLDAERSRLATHDQKGRAAKDVSLKSNERSQRVELITAGRSQSVLADCFRATATSILYAGENGDRPRVIVLTSAIPGEGKTTVASNLALALAEIGSSVLLIDGDLRKGRLHEIFQAPNSWGVSDLLAGKTPPEGHTELYFETCYEHLSLLPAGSEPSSITELLHSPRTLLFLNDMREEFHTIIIDTPPMLQMPDARVLGRLADGVILVVRSAKTTREEAMAATQRLTDDRTRVLGTILNEWDPRKTSHPAYAHAYRYYQHDANRG
jgi:succinoglycan biosynthesis transport protein ExoP